MWNQWKHPQEDQEEVWENRKEQEDQKEEWGDQKGVELVDQGRKVDHWVQADVLKEMGVQQHQEADHMEEVPISKQEPDLLVFHGRQEEWMWQEIQCAQQFVGKRMHEMGCG